MATVSREEPRKEGDETARHGSLERYIGISPAWYIIVLITAVLVSILFLYNYQVLMISAPPILFSLLFILFDLILYGERRDRRLLHGGKLSESAAHYRPNLQMWSMGLIMGIGVSAIYLFHKSILALLNSSSARSAAIDRTLGNSAASGDLAANWSAQAASLARDLSYSAFWESLVALVALTIVLIFVIWATVRLSKSE
jgi:hypothetical protein